MGGFMRWRIKRKNSENPGLPCVAQSRNCWCAGRYRQAATGEALSNVCKHIRDMRCRARRCLKKRHAVDVCKSTALFLHNLTPVRQVGLVSNQYHD
jgi:hypothetical protein